MGEGYFSLGDHDFGRLYLHVLAISSVTNSGIGELRKKRSDASPGQPRSTWPPPGRDKCVLF